MPYQKITSTPVDLGLEHSLSEGDVYDLQAVSAKSAIYYIAAEDAPVAGDRGLRLGFDEEPYPAEIPASPAKLWAWTESGNDGDLYFELSSAGLAGGGGGGGGGSSGGGSVFAPLYRSGSTSQGIEVGVNRDASWSFVGEDREAVGALPSARLNGETSGARLDVELPRTLVASSDGNDWAIEVEQGIEDVAAITEVLPSASLSGETAGASIEIEIPNDLATPADGNDWVVGVEQGAEDTLAVDATLPSATLDGETTGSSIEVTIPEDLVDPTDGNDWDVRVHQVREFQAATTATRAHHDLVFTSGTDAGKGIRLTLAGTHSSSMGAAGNNVIFSLAVGTSVNASAFTTFYNMTAVPGTSTLAQLFTEADVGGNNYQFDAEYIGGADGTEIVQSATFPFGVSANFIGGLNTAASVAGGILEASISTANERIVIRTKSTDTIGAIAAVLHALSYTDANGATQTFSAANAVVTGTGFLNETTYYAGDTGDTVDVGFDGGVDAIPFANGDLISVTLNATTERIDITANSADTINNIAALLQSLAYTDLDGNSQTFGCVSYHADRLGHPQRRHLLRWCGGRHDRHRLLRRRHGRGGRGRCRHHSGHRRDRRAHHAAGAV